MRDLALEDRLGRKAVLVGVEVVAAQVREVGDVVVRDRARFRHEGIADLELVEVLAERVHSRRLPLRAGDELVEYA